MEDYYPDFFWQTREALVREIRDAQRWSSIQEATLALLKVIRVGEKMRQEAEYLAGKQQHIDKPSQQINSEG